MNASSGSRLIQLAAAVAVAATLLGCTETVYKDFPGFQPPPTAAGSYMGYTSTSGQLPVCGNCHASHQALWATAKHSTAWADLQASGHAGPTCDACHSVNSLGNDTAGTPKSGYVGDPTERYQDVQCEACHGPGQNHVDNPEVTANVPVPSIYVAVGLNSSCSGCHTGSHNPFVDDWAKSPHGTMPHGSSPLGNTTSNCKNCHSGQLALLNNFMVNSTYKEKNNTPLTTYGPNNALKIVCAVCHDPHGSPNKGQLRLSVDTIDVGANLCARCHNRRAVPDVTSSSGPHSPEGALVIGENGEVGWRPPLMLAAAGGTERVYGSHGDPTVNTGLCATCHVFKSQALDTLTGQTVYSTGHLFLAIPCLGTNGLPDSVSTCGMNATARSFTSCAGGGCHGTGAVASTLLNTEVVTIQLLLGQLRTLLNDTMKVKCSQYAVTSTLTTARGARFNYLLASEAAPSGTTDAVCGSTRNIPPPIAKPGAAAHNVPLIEQLLQYSILQVQKDYP